MEEIFNVTWQKHFLRLMISWPILKHWTPSTKYIIYGGRSSKVGWMDTWTVDVTNSNLTSTDLRSKAASIMILRTGLVTLITPWQTPWWRDICIELHTICPMKRSARSTAAVRTDLLRVGWSSSFSELSEG